MIPSSLKFSIAGKLALVFTLLSIAVTGTAGMMGHYWNSRDLIEKELRLLGQECRNRSLRMEQQISGYSRDARFLAAVPPVEGIMRSQDSGTDPVDGTPYTLWKERMTLIFTQFLLQNPAYFQIRFIGAADRGRELVRVEKNRDSILVTPEAELQDKSGRDYFRAVTALPPGKVFLSKINYNREHGRITRPETRTLRVALPVFRGTLVFGMIVINVDIGPELDRLGRLPSEAVYLFNPEGQFLIHPDPGRGFGFEAGGGPTMAEDAATRFIDLSRTRDDNLLPAETGGVSQADGVRVWVDGDAVKAFSRIILASPDTGTGHRLLYMLAVTPKTRVLRAVSRNQRHSVYLTLALILLSAVLILLFSRYLTRPLTRMTQEVAGFRSGGGKMASRAGKGDEIHVLGRAFATMTRRIDQSISELEARERRLQSIMFTAAEGLIIIDAQGRINDLNPATEAIFGYTREELMGRNVAMLMPSPHAEVHDTYIARYLETGKAAIIGKGRSETARRKDGRLVPVSLSISEFRVKDRLFFTGFIRDVTEEATAREALTRAKLELEDRVAERTDQLSLLNSALRLKVGELNATADRLRLFEQIFTQSGEAIVITDENERIIEVNDAYVRTSGYSRKLLIGSTPRIGRSGNHDKAFYENMWEMIQTHGSWKGEVWDRRRSGDVFPKLLSISAVADAAGNTTHYVGIFSDISKLKATEEKLKNLAYYDPLTGLPNRALFRVLLQKEIDQSVRSKSLLGIMYLDLDRFKYVNDTYGHSMGDRLLKKVSERLGSCLRKSDTVARLGGDEFVVLLRQLDRPESAARLAEKLLGIITRPVCIEEKELFVGVSIGISLCPEDGCDLETLMKNADMAMYRVKENGRNHYRFFEPEMDRIFARRVALDKALRHALKRDEFICYYQPKVAVDTGMICGAEALIRWRRASGELVMPNVFIPIAEETGLIESIGFWVLRTASRQCRIWTQSYPHPFKMSVNLSMRQFLHQDLMKTLIRILEETGLDPDCLDLEITESVVASDMDRTVEIQNAIRSLGVSLSIDDFGTGYSSLSYLKTFPIQNLKVDRSFVSDIAVNRDDASIVRAIIAMGHSLGLRVVAEGVETREQLEFLKALNCNEYQGYYFRAPMPAEDFDALLAGSERLSVVSGPQGLLPAAPRKTP